MSRSAARIKQLWLINVVILLFLVPSNLFTVLSEASGYVTGLRVDYLLPKLYLSDLFAWSAIFLGGWLWLKTHHASDSLEKIQKALRDSLSKRVAVVMTLILCIQQVLSPHPLISGWFTIQLIEAVLLGFVLSANRHTLSIPLLTQALAATVIFQTVIALIQFSSQSSVWGYVLLGEVTLAAPYGIAHTSLWGRELALAYGTTAHPNVLAGVVILYSLILWKWRIFTVNKASTMYTTYIALGCSIIILVLTQSVSAALALGVGMLGLLHMRMMKQSPKKATISAQIERLDAKTWWQLPAWMWLILLVFIITPVVLLAVQQLVPESTSLTRRVWLNESALAIIGDHPVIGTGLNLFTTQLHASLPIQEFVRFTQPVHHLGLLWIAETGLLGLAWFSAVIFAFRQHISWNRYALACCALVPIAVLDHYLLTLQTGRLLTVIFIVLMSLHFTNKRSESKRN